MPKKATHGRPKQNRNRPRRAPTRPVNTVDSTTPVNRGLDEEVSMQSGFTSSGGVVASPRPASRPAVPAPASRRSASAARRAPVVTVNYHYLSRDLRSLAMLAPAMVVLLVISFFVFH